MSVKNLGLWVRLILRIPTFSQYFASKRGCGLYPGAAYTPENTVTSLRVLKVTILTHSQRSLGQYNDCIDFSITISILTIDFSSLTR